MCPALVKCRISLLCGCVVGGIRCGGSFGIGGGPWLLVSL
jgi:hypothetical protein